MKRDCAPLRFNFLTQTTFFAEPYALFHSSRFAHCK